jgi:hypothetical protein
MASANGNSGEPVRAGLQQRTVQRLHETDTGFAGCQVFLIFGKSGWIGGLVGDLLMQQGAKFEYASARLEDRSSILAEIERVGPPLNRQPRCPPCSTFTAGSAPAGEAHPRPQCSRPDRAAQCGLVRNPQGAGRPTSCCAAACLAAKNRSSITGTGQDQQGHCPMRGWHTTQSSASSLVLLWRTPLLLYAHVAYCITPPPPPLHNRWRPSAAMSSAASTWRTCACPRAFT